MLLDDEVGELIGQIKNGELMMLVDACNSGTVDKSVSNKGLLDTRDSAYVPAETSAVKGHGYLPGTPKVTSPTARDPVPSARYVAINAAQDDQYARASPNGSFFTLGLAEALKAAKAEGSITPKELRNQAQAFITANVKPTEAQHTPQLQGNEELSNRRIRIASTADNPRGELWAKFEELLKQSGNPGMTVSTDKGARITIGQWYTLQISLPKDVSGYLSVVAVDSGSEDATVLFPNDWEDQETQVSAGATVKLPASDTTPWGLQALEPPSTTLVVALVTAEPLGLYQKGIRKSRINAQHKAFASLSSSGLQAITKGAGDDRRVGAVGRTTSPAQAKVTAAGVIVDIVKPE